VVSTGGGAAAAPALAPVAEPKPKLRVGIWILVVVLAAIVFWAVGQMNEHRYYDATANSQQAAQPQPQPRLHTQATGDTAFTIPAGGFYHYKLAVPAGAFNVNLKGHFTASGGSGSDVEGYVLSEDAYVNWQNAHSVSTLYNSGRVTQGSLNVSLPSDAGTYYVLFSNKFSFLSPKAVQANLTLTYYTR